MKEILNITFRLTVSCLLAAVVMGSTFIITNKAKKHNEHVREEQVMYQLLGYGGEENPIPESLNMHQIYRYIVTEDGKQFIGYLLPAAEGAAAPFVFVVLDLDGKMAWSKEIAAAEDVIHEKEDRDKAILAAIGSGKTLTYVEETIVVTDGPERMAYLLGGKFQGFKVLIGVKVALSPEYAMLGFEVLEHEEDPGLGAEIEQDYFKNQFKGKSFETLRGLQVVKEPLPGEYEKALEGDLDEEQTAKLMEQYRENDIYALTGATISSRAVTEGLKGIVRKFAYRLDTLDKVLKEQHIDVSF